MILLLAFFLIVLTAFVTKYLKIKPKVKTLIIMFIVFTILSFVFLNRFFGVMLGLDFMIERVTQSDVNIFLITLFVLGLSGIVYKFGKKVPWLIRVLAILLFIGWLIDIFIPNIPLLIAPMTPTIKGKIFDAETRRPLTNIDIKVAWPLHNVGPGGGGGLMYKTTYTTKSDEHGEFIIPRRWKPVSRWVFPLGFSNYAGIAMIAYSYDYEFRELWPKEHIIEIPMKPIKDEKTFLENILNIYWEGVSKMGPYIEDSYKNLSPDEKRFFMNAYEQFEKKYPDTTVDKDYLGSVASMFEKLGAPQKAIGINQKIINKYPSSINAEIARDDVKRLEETYHLKSDNKFNEGTK